MSVAVLLILWTLAGCAVTRAGPAMSLPPQNDRGVLGSKDRRDAGLGHRLGLVDCHDLGVGMGRAQKDGIKLVRAHDVMHIAPAAGQKAPIFAAAKRCANPIFAHGDLFLPPWPPTGGADLTMFREPVQREKLPCLRSLAACPPPPTRIIRPPVKRRLPARKSLIISWFPIRTEDERSDGQILRRAESRSPRRSGARVLRSAPRSA